MFGVNTVMLVLLKGLGLGALAKLGSLGIVGIAIVVLIILIIGAFVLFKFGKKKNII